MAPEFFSEVADLFTEPALLVRTDGRVLAVNRAAKRLGLVEEDSVGRPLAELTPMPAGEVDRFLRTAARSSNPSPGALVLRSPKGAQAKCRVFGAAISNGSRVSPPEQVLIRIVPPENAADSPFALLGRKIRELDAEIRERRRLEVGLRGERERLEVTLSSIGDGVIITDTTGRVEFLNAIAEALTGWCSDEALGRSLEEVFAIVSEQSRNAADNPVRRVLETGRIVGLANHTILIARDGTERAIDDSAAPIRDRDGNILGVVLVFRDVTGKRKTELDLARLAAIVSSSEDAIIGLGLDGVVTNWNESAEKLFGFSAREAIGRSLCDTIVPPDRRDEFFSNLQRIARGEALDHYETRRRAKDGRAVDVSIRISPIRDAEREIIGASAIDRDISEQKSSERQRTVRLAVNQALTLADQPSIVIRKVLEAVVTGLEWSIGAFWVMDPDRRVLRCAELYSEQGADFGDFANETRSRLIELGEGIVGSAWATSRSLCLSSSEKRDRLRSESARRAGLEVGLACPVFADGRTLGVLELFGRQALDGEDDTIELVSAIGLQLGQYLDRREAERNLRASEERLRLALQAGRMGNWEWDIASGRMIWSAGLEQLHGIEPGTFPGTIEAFEKEIHPEDRARVRAEMEAALHSGDDYRAEYRIVTADGELRWLEARGEIFRAADRKPARMVGVCVDVTERKNSEERLRESELRFRQLAENVQSVFWMADPRVPAILYVSPAFETIWDRTREELYARRDVFFDSVHDDDRSQVQDAIERQNRGEPTAVEYRIVRQDGSVRWIWDRAFPILDDTGDLERVCGVAEDITERKISESTTGFLLEASRSLAALVDFRSTLQKIARLAVPGFCDWCAVDILSENGELERLAVAHLDPAKAELALEIWRRFPPKRDLPFGVFQVLRSGEPEMIPELPDDVLRQATRNEEHFAMVRRLAPRSYMCVPLLGRDRVIGAISFVGAESGRRFGQQDLATAQELAHRASVAIDNTRLYNELREADRRKDEFLAMLAHELRNPLAPIRSGLEVLAMDSGGSDNETIELMQRQVDHLVRLVDDLLDVSRIMRGRIELRRERVELSKILAQAVDTIRPAIRTRNQRLRLSTPSEEVWLDADPVRLVQIIENLLGNASKYTDPEGRIELVGERDGDHVIVRIRDEGMGIEPELLPTIFELFTQSRRSLDRAQGGLGIGLTLVRSLVHLHGGSVSVRSAGPGQGSEFTVRLPGAQAGAPRDRSSRRMIAPFDVARRILVVDDNFAAARLLRLLLLRLGDHEVRVAHDGTAALTEARAFGPEVIFLDIGLPGMDGYEVARRLREDPEFSRVLLVALTGYGQAEDRLRSFEAGFDEHLVKPPDIGAIRRVLGRSSRRGGSDARGGDRRAKDREE